MAVHVCSKLVWNVKSFVQKSLPPNSAFILTTMPKINNVRTYSISKLKMLNKCFSLHHNFYINYDFRTQNYMTVLSYVNIAFQFTFLYALELKYSNVYEFNKKYIFYQSPKTYVNNELCQNRSKYLKVSIFWLPFCKWLFFGSPFYKVVTIKFRIIT